MPKFDRLRTMLGNGELHWLTDLITCGIVKNYTFDTVHATMTDIQTTGTLLATGKLVGKNVTIDGYAQSAAVQLKLVASGGPYDVILFHDPGGTGELSPLVHYEDVVTLAATGDVLVRPAGSVDAGVGTWFRF